MLITLGDQDIDLSPSFVIFLSTRDPTVRNEIHLRYTVGVALGVTAQVTKWTVLLLLLAGGVPTRLVFPGHICQLHGHP